MGANALLEKIVGEYLGVLSGDSEGDVKNDSDLIAEVIARVEALEKAIAFKPPTTTHHQPSPPPTNPHQSPPVHTSLATDTDATTQTGLLLTIGQAHAEAKRRGFDGSMATFKRWIKAGDRPGGVVPDWEARAKYPAKSNAAKWLCFEGWVAQSATTK